MPDEKKAAEDAVMQLRYLQSIYMQQYDALESEIATYSFTIAAIERNMSILNSTGKIEGSKVLISGEGGTYIEASIKSMENVITYVGAGYFIEKGIDDARSFLSKNMSRQEEDFRKLIAEKQRLEGELIGISYQLAALQQ